MLSFNDIKESVQFNDIQTPDNMFLQSYYNNLFVKVVKFELLSDTEKDMFYQNINNGCIFKYKVKDKDELIKIIGSRLNPIAVALPPSKEYSTDGTYEVGRILMNLNWLDVSDITDMQGVFNFNLNWYGQFFDVSDWDVSNVTNMCGMFYKITNFNCDISKWDVSNVTNMQDMFTGCHDFNQDISEWDVSNVTNMQEMFNFCIKFNLDLSKWDVSKVNNMIGMFDMCIEFDLDLSNWNVLSLKKFNNIFNNCVKLKNMPSWYYDIRN